MRESIHLFLVGLLKRAYYWVPPIFLDPFDVYNRYLKHVFHTGDIEMPSKWGLIAFVIMIFWAAIMTYHELRKTTKSTYDELRKARLDELYKYLPEANKDKIFRIFYELLKEGRFLKNANTVRRQEWDERVIKEIKNYCSQEFENIYFLNTGRRNQRITPLEDINYDKALYEIEKLIDVQFDWFIK